MAVSIKSSKKNAKIAGRTVLRNFAKKKIQAAKKPKVSLSVSQIFLRPLPILFMLILLMVLAAGISIILIPKAVSQAQPQAILALTCVEGNTISCECGGVRTCQGGRYGICQYGVSCTPGDIEPCFEAGCYTGRRLCNECGRWDSCVPVSSFVQ